jgi:hypothetical protein
MTIGHVIPLAGKTEMVNPIFSDFLAGAGEVYAREGYDMLLSVVAPDGAGDAYRQMAANGSVDGVMVQGPQVDDPRVPLLQELGLPFLVHGRTNSATDYSWLDIANRGLPQGDRLPARFRASAHRAHQRTGKLRFRRPSPRRFRGGASPRAASVPTPR